MAFAAGELLAARDGDHRAVGQSFMSDTEAKLLERQRRQDAKEHRRKHNAARRAELLQAINFMEKVTNKAAFEAWNNSRNLPLTLTETEKIMLHAVVNDFSKKGALQTELEADIANNEAIRQLEATDATVREECVKAIARKKYIISLLEISAKEEGLKKQTEKLKELTRKHTGIDQGESGEFVSELTRDLNSMSDTDEKYNSEWSKKKNEYTRQLEALRREDSFLDQVFTTFMRDDADALSAAGFGTKLGLVLTLPLVNAARDSLDAQYIRVTNRAVRYVSEYLHDVAVSFGFASPLSVKKVMSWNRMVTSFKKSMDNYAKGSSDSTDVAAAFGARAANRPEKPGYSVDAPATDMAAQVNAGEEVDDATEYIRQAEPVYVKTTTDFVRQLRRQITVIVRRMKGESYVEQREILSEILKTLDVIGYLAVGSFKVYRQVNFTQVLNRDISLCCESILNQLVGLKDLINSADEADEPSSTTSSVYGNKQSRLGLD